MAKSKTTNAGRATRATTKPKDKQPKEKEPTYSNTLTDETPIQIYEDKDEQGHSRASVDRELEQENDMPWGNGYPEALNVVSGDPKYQNLHRSFHKMADSLYCLIVFLVQFMNERRAPYY